MIFWQVWLNPKLCADAEFRIEAHDLDQLSHLLGKTDANVRALFALGFGHDPCKFGDRRLKKNQNMKRMCVLALRENGSGLEWAFARIVREQQGNAAWATVRDHVSRDATIVTDEHTSYADITDLN